MTLQPWKLRNLLGSGAQELAHSIASWGGEGSNHSAVIYVIMAIPLKCVAVLFRMSPEGNTTLSAIKVGLHFTQKLQMLETKLSSF